MRLLEMRTSLIALAGYVVIIGAALGYIHDNFKPQLPMTQVARICATDLTMGCSR
jgi:hypothetical protein